MTPSQPRVEWVDAAPNADFASTVRLERAKAGRSGRTLVVYVGADWCPPCKAFHEAVLAGQLDAQLGKVTFLVFDFDRDASKMGAFGYQTTHIPYFVKPGPDGGARSRLQRQNAEQTGSREGSHRQARGLAVRQVGHSSGKKQATLCCPLEPLEERRLDVALALASALAARMEPATARGSKGEGSSPTTSSFFFFGAFAASCASIGAESSSTRV